MDEPDHRRRLRRGVAAAIGLVLAGSVALILALVLSSGSSPRRAVPPATGTGLQPSPGTTPAPSPQPSAGPPAQPPPPGVDLGASVNLLFTPESYGPREIDLQLSELRGTGATIARGDAFWEASEPSAPVDGVHRYDWRFDDRIAGALAAHGLRWVPIIDYSAPWAQSIPGRDHSPPSSPSDYARYAAEVAKRYGTGGSFWREHPSLPAEPVQIYEIWNEPDNPVFWSPTPDAARYANLYLEARDAITLVDPNARVIIGGLTHPEKFLPEMLAARPDLRGHVDGVGIHPYAPTPIAVLERIGTARQVLRSLDIAGVPLYATEFGWTTHPPGVRDYLPEALRPGYVEATVAALGHLDCELALGSLYTWVSPERHLHDREDWFGINPPNGGGSADTAGFADGLRRAREPGALIRICG